MIAFEIDHGINHVIDLPMIQCMDQRINTVVYDRSKGMIDPLIDHGGDHRLRLLLGSFLNQSKDYFHFGSMLRSIHGLKTNQMELLENFQNPKKIDI